MKSVIAMPTATQPRTAEPGTDSLPPQVDSAAAPSASVGQDRGRPPRVSQRPQPVSPPGHGPFVPLLLGGLAVLGWLGFQSAQLLTERSGLMDAHLSQQQTVDSAARLRGSLDVLAADTQRMALAGNPSAKLLIDELGKRGVTINATASTTTPAAPVPATPATAAPAMVGR